MILVCGETLADLVPTGADAFRALPGGSPANVAVGIARLGEPAAMLARISRDRLGSLLRRHLADNGVDLRHVVAADEPATLAVVSLDEAGLKGYDLTAWFAAFAPAKTPKAIVDRLNAAFREALADNDVSSKLLAAGIEPVASSPEELGSFVVAETAKWAKIVKDAKIEPE